MRNIKRTRSGVTLIELILSIALISMIVVVLFSLFVMSSKINIKSEETLDSTYLGKDAMELAYDLSQTIFYDKLEEELVVIGYSFDEFNQSFGYKYSDNKYLNIKFSEKGNLVKVFVEIYEDQNMNQLEVQYESLYSWKGRGILSEE